MGPTLIHQSTRVRNTGHQPRWVPDNNKHASTRDHVGLKCGPTLRFLQLSRVRGPGANQRAERSFLE
ncbi:hypothetical protein PIB30_071008, partial [Stylosanthes scabra]|nr:hypothetical protein [Stylosanthes scabra]